MPVADETTEDWTTEDWTTEDRAAARAFLQRCEVRLSTLHRVATALLSGAGLMVLLPALVREQIVEVLRTLVSAEGSAAHVMLTVTAAVVLFLPFLVFFLLLGDLTRFYFHAQHVPGEGADAFAPRFTLTGLRLPADELSASAARSVMLARADPATIELLVPSNVAAQTRIDAKLDAYGGLGRRSHPGDAGRAQGLFELLAARERPLAEEVAKVEYGMARHLLRLQVIVMRYVKALLAFLVTTLAVFAALAVVRHDHELGHDSDLWLAGIFATWAPTMVFAVASPVRWVADLLRAEGATVNAVGADHEFTRIERIAVVAATIGWLLAAASIVSVLGDASGPGATTALGALALSAGLLGLAVVRSVATGTRRR